jgi:hypothetical protein
VDNKTSDEMTRKMRNRTNRATNNTSAPRLLPKLKSLPDLGTRFEAMVTEEVIDDASL